MNVGDVRGMVDLYTWVMNNRRLRSQKESDYEVDAALRHDDYWH